METKTTEFPVCNKRTVVIMEDKIADLETFFATATLPPTIKLNEWSTIIDLPKFVESHMAIVKANPGKKWFLPYLERLQRLRELLMKKEQ